MTKMLKATHEGKLTIGETELNCAVLEDGTRVISRNAIFRAFGRTKRGRAKNEVRVPNMPSFIDANNLQPFIDADLRDVLNQHDYIALNGKEDSGYNALILPKLCKVYLDARQDKVLKTQQLPLARASEILLIGLSNVGIIALVDEATGYQYDREAQELQKILKAYIAEQLFPWQKRFPDVFYREIFRLNGWDYTVKDIRKRPGVIGTWTNNLIYKPLPPGVLDELKNRTPKNEKGNRKHRFHQLLTLDIGQPDLQRQLTSVITIMQLSKDWNDFEHKFNQLYGQRSLEFPEAIEPIKKIGPEKELSSFDKNLKTALDYNPKEEKPN